MNRSAVFVDAGYLFAAGSALLAGSKQARHLISIHENAAVLVIGAHWTDYQQIPKLLDGRLLASTRERLHRNLAGQERSEMRTAFLNAARRRHPSGF